MSPGAFWLAVAGGMLVTFGTRASFFLLPQTEWLPRPFLRGLRFVPPAVLGALVATMVAEPVAELGFTGAWPRLAAILVAAVSGWKTRNMWVTIGLGMASLWILQSVAGP